MATQTTPIGKFRERMKMFLERLKTYLDRPHLRELDKFQTKYDLGMKADPRGTTGLFVDSLKPYAHQIMQGQDSFFLNELDIEPEYAGLAESLRSLWPTLDEGAQQYIRDQFKLLLMLGAIAVRDEEVRCIINDYRDPANPLTF